MDHLGKVELQVAKWITYLLYIYYYLYSRKQCIKILWEIGSATPKVWKIKLCKIPWEI